MKKFYKDALDAYLAANPDAADPVSLEAPAQMRVYIENRLRRAFEAGWNAGTESYERRASSGELTV